MNPASGTSFLADPLAPRRRPTREVSVGGVGIGAANPIRVQSMTTTDTLDTKATADETERLVAAGCEIVRITAPSIRDAENLRAISAELSRRGIRVPLVADIHFTPNAALIAAEHVQKVRINPGNYADKKRFEVREYSDAQYREELERVGERFRPLVRRCRELGVAMRIGTNHGSLSDRILNRYGDTPLGMVESALEFLDVCERESYRDVVFSMKASNAQVAIQAYRLLAARLAARARASGEGDYPFHVGVTEAGDGEDGRVKSAIGIGALLEDGLGDTVRVSLTEDPVKELPVARALVRRAEARLAATVPLVSDGVAAPLVWVDDPFAHERRSTRRVQFAGLALGEGEAVRVEIERALRSRDVRGLAAELATSLGLLGEVECESLGLRAFTAEEAAALPLLRKELTSLGLTLPLALRLPAAALGQLGPQTLRAVDRLVIELRPQDEIDEPLRRTLAEQRQSVEWCLVALPEEVALECSRAISAHRETGLPPPLFSACTETGERAAHAARALAAALRGTEFANAPIVLRHARAAQRSDEDAALDAAIDLGSPLCDGLGDLVSLESQGDPARDVDLAYRVLQGSRLRTTRTEYISCPSCGRTLFDLEETTARVKDATSHLKGVKIAVMGCIVNGPGEMADADFGYVGSGPGQVNLYKGHEVIERGVPEADAPDRLVRLIQDHGAWHDRLGD